MATKREAKISSKYTAFRCPLDLLALAKVQSQKDRRSFSNYIITLIAKDVESIPADEREQILANLAAPKKVKRR